jgi:hypothetical protein
MKPLASSRIYFKGFLSMVILGYNNLISLLLIQKEVIVV